MSNQSGVQAAIRASTGTAGTYTEDWHALWDDAAVAAGTFNERMLAWINGRLSSIYTNVNEAMQAYAEDQGFDAWSSMDNITLAPSLAVSFAVDEPQVLVLDFTDDYFKASTGFYGSAYIRNDSGAQILAGDESDVLALDFTDNQFVADTSQYGSAYIRTS